MARAERSPASPRLRRRYLGPYRLARCLGRGSFAHVYAAVRQGDSAWVAVKVVLPGEHCPDSVRQRLLMEGHLAMGIEHPNVVRYLDVGEEAGAVYVVQELVDGGDVCALLTQHQQRVPAAVIARVGRDAAEGLHALHQRGLLHRDVKPANLLLTRDGACKVADLGLIRPLRGRNGITATGMVVGTPSYVAPEQIRNDSEIDGRADVYSLAAALYWLATGQTPHQADTLWGMLTRAVGEPFPDPRDLRPDLPEELAQLIRTAGSKEPAARHRDAAELADAFELFLESSHAGSPLPARSSPASARASTAARHAPLALLIGVDPLLSRLHAGRLLVEGWRVRLAHDAQATSAALARERPDVVVIDLELPDGTALLQRLRAMPDLDAVPVIILAHGSCSGLHLSGITRVVDRGETSPRALLLLLQRLLAQPGTRTPHSQAQPVSAILERLRPCLDGDVLGASNRLDDLAASAQGLNVIATSANLGIASAIAQAVEIYARQLRANPPGGLRARQTLERAVDALIATFTSPLPTPAWPARDVLMLESDPFVRRLVAVALRRVGIGVRAARTINEALRSLAERPASLILVESRLTASPGGFLAAVRRLAPVPLLFGAEGSIDLDLDRLPGVDRIDRPYSAGELLAKTVTALILAAPA